MDFTKLQGSGNDFIVIDNRDGKVQRLLKDRGISVEDFVVKLCTPHTGVGADGLILIEEPKDPENDFRWQFFNADGSVAEMCGNGSRCAVRFCYEKGIVGERVKFETLAGVIKAQVLEGGKRVKVQLTPPSEPRDRCLEADGLTVKGTFINTGVPHFVVPSENLESLNVKSLGRAIRFHEEFRPQGTNVNFVEPVSESTLKIRTYERGVEAETLACGTGATASAIVAYLKGLVKEKPVEVITKGGEVLKIDFSDDLKEVYLEGSVCKVYDGLLSYEVFTC